MTINTSKTNNKYVEIKELSYYPFVSIIILNYNGKMYLKNCFESIQKIIYPSDRYEVILVDNNSVDRSVEYVKKEFPWVRVIPLSKNYGYTGGNNIGAKYAKGELLVFLNNDTVVDKRWLIELVKVAISSEKIGICGSKIVFLDFPHILQYSGGYLHVLGGGIFPNFGKPDTLLEKHPMLTGCIHGSSFLIKQKIFYEIGLFDSDYFLYNDEADICLRTQLRGYDVIYVPKSKVYHAYHGTQPIENNKMKELLKKQLLRARMRSNITIFYTNRNALQTILKNFDNPMYILLGIVLAYGYGMIQLFIMLKNKKYWNNQISEAIKLLVSAYIWPLKNIKKIISKRKKVQKMRKRSLKDLIDRGVFLSFTNTIRAGIAFTKRQGESM